MQHTFARWLIDHDLDATRRCYARLPVGSGCTCDGCQNFDAAAGKAFPSEFLALLGALGVEPTKPAELCHYHREPSGLFLTGGWFHLVGSIVTGEDAMHMKDNIGTLRLEELVPGLHFGFTANLALVQEVFAGLPLVQLEFQAHVPWVLPKPAPEA